MYRLLVQRGTPFPNPEQLFCDDMIQWHGVLDDVLQGPDFPSGPDPENDQVLAALRQTLDEQFGELFPTQIPREWTTTTAYGSLWLNYRIDQNGGLNTELTIAENCYTPRLSHTERSQVQIAGVDCSGFVQRCAAPHHTCIPELGQRQEWDDVPWSFVCAISAGNFASGSACNNDITTGIGSGSIGQYPDLNDDDADNDLTARRMVPGDLIAKSGHCAIVNYITGDRGEDDPLEPDYRDGEDVWIIHAISSPQYVNFGADDPDTWASYDGVRNGQVTDTWTWETFNNAKSGYVARRLLP